MQGSALLTVVGLTMILGVAVASRPTDVVPMTEQVVYCDASQAASWVNGVAQVAEWLQGRGFTLENADELAAWMGDAALAITTTAEERHTARLGVDGVLKSVLDVASGRMGTRGPAPAHRCRPALGEPGGQHRQLHPGRRGRVRHGLPCQRRECRA